MSKFTITVTSGVAAVYPCGQQYKSATIKEGQSVSLELGPDAGPKMAEVAGLLGLVYDAIKADLGAPAAGVAKDEKYGKRDGTLEVRAVDGAVLVRTYEGSDYTEQLVAEGDSVTVAVTESNKITLAVYEAPATPK